MFQFAKDSFSGLVNRMTGTGTARDKATHSRWQVQAQDFEQLSTAYRTSWMCRKAVDIPAFDMLRRGWSWQVDEAAAKLIKAEEDRLQLRAKLLKAETLGRLFGGAITIMSDGSDNLEAPMNQTPGKGGLRFLVVMSRLQVMSSDLNQDPMDPLYMEPEFYRISAGRRGQVRIHPSRVIRHLGNEMPDEGLFTADTWGDSVLHGSFDAIKASTTMVQTFGRLADEQTVNYHKIKGLMEALGSDEGTEKIRRAIELTERMKSAVNAVVVDSETDVEQFTANFSGLPESLQAVLQVVAASQDIPITRFLGQSPGGMNATGDSDFRNYYDKLSSMQELGLDPKLQRIHGPLLHSALGNAGGGAVKTFNPLWQLTEKEQIEVDRGTADTLKVYMDGGLIPDAVLQKIARAELIGSAGFPGADTAFKESDAEGTDTISGGSDDEVDQANRLQAGDAAPRTLYIRRDVVNRAEIAAWAKSQGLTDIVPDLHVTIAYSAKPVDWFKVGTSYSDKVEIAAGGPRQMAAMGPTGKYKALLITANELVWRHEEIKRAGASWNWPEYQPHISIQIGGDVDVESITPYQGPITLGPEIFEELREDPAP